MEVFYRFHTAWLLIIYFIFLSSFVLLFICGIFLEQQFFVIVFDSNGKGHNLY